MLIFADDIELMADKGVDGLENVFLGMDKLLQEGFGSKVNLVNT